MKPKNCPCGIRFTPTKPLQKHHSRACEISFKSGKVTPENEINLDLPVLRGLATGSFQTFIRMKYKDCGCYTCGTKKGLFHGGHYFKKELFSGMIFNEVTTRLQCDFCNTAQDGSLNIFREKLIKELGIVAFIEQENKSIAFKNYRWSKLELIEKHKEYTKKIKLLTASNNVGSDVKDVVIMVKK